jgi:hypothetical protein
MVSRDKGLQQRCGTALNGAGFRPRINNKSRQDVEVRVGKWRERERKKRERTKQNWERKERKKEKRKKRSIFVNY